MTTLKPLDEFLDDSLDLPVRCRDGQTRTFHIPGVSGEDGLRVQRLMEVGLQLAAGAEDVRTDVLDDAQELDLYRTALGPAYEDAIAQLDWPRFRHVAMTAVVWITQGLEAAEAYWLADGRPSQQGPANRAERRASSRAAKSTPSPASRSGTSTRTGTGRARKAAAT